MLYMNEDGTFTIDDRPTPVNLQAKRERERRMAENEARFAAMLEQVAAIERERETAAEVAERDEVIETVEMAEEAAMAELEQFGCVEFDTALSDAEWNETSGEFWEFAVDLFNEPRAYVLTELY